MTEPVYFTEVRERCQRVVGDILMLIAEVQRLQRRVEELEARPQPPPPPEREVPAPQKDRQDRTFLDTHRAAEWLGLSGRTLEQWRVHGGGPLYHKLGRRVLYRVEDLAKWVAERKYMHTSQESVEVLARGRPRRGSRDGG